MSENNYDNRKLQNKYLKIFYKKYVDCIVDFEKHIEKLYNDWVIDIDDRNYVLHKLDEIVRNIRFSYDSQVEKYQGIKKYNKSTSKSNYKKKLFKNKNNKSKSIPHYMFKIYEGIEAIKQLENKSNNIDEPFSEIKSELVILCKENGYISMSGFLKLYFNWQYKHFLEKEDSSFFNLYNKVFVPINIIIEENKPYNKINICRIISKCDSLIDNTCKITVSIRCLGINIIFDGYISSDILNTYIRTSKFYSKYLFNIKSDAQKIIKEEYPHIEEKFLIRYFKLTNSNHYFVNNSQELVEKIVHDHNMFKEISNKNFNQVMKDYVHSDLRTMFNMINLLLMGNEKNINTATLLFNLLRDKKINGNTLSDIIYHNMPYYLQIKIKKVTSNMKNELNRLKTLSPENISISKKLAILVNMPDNVKTYILEKINEMKSGENSYKLQMAINGLMQFPWKPKDYRNNFSYIKNSLTKSRDYLQNVAKKLDETVYGHENSKKVLIELVGKWIQNPESTGQVIGLIGPPGTGKTLLAKSISTALGIPLTIVGLGGMNDASDLIGHSFTYAGAQYGMIVRQMIKAGNWRCVMFFDEVDKVSKRNDTNEIYNTLIHITDPNMNQHFQDRFYSSSIEFDLSGVLIVFSYNDSSKLDPILLDRIKEINISAYSTEEKITISQNYIMKDLCNNIGFDYTKIYFDNSTVKYIIEKYTLEAGVRELKRKMEQILLKLNIDRFYMRGPFINLMKQKYLITVKSNIDIIDTEENIDLKKDTLKSYTEYKKSKLEDFLDEEIINEIFNLKFDGQIIINQDLVHRYLEKPIIMVEEIHKNNFVGVVNGLYASLSGIGGIVPIQIFKNYIGASGDGTNLKLKLTGNQQKVMRESVICALTTAINLLNKDIRTKIMDNFPNGFHVHAPDGGTPKDGPSAGCAFTTAFVSVLLCKKINRYIAMTGEIELTGKISKIGDLSAKLSGAKKAGVKCIYICEENKEDYIKIKNKSPELFDNNFEVKIIEHIIDIVTDPNVIIEVRDTDFDPDVLAEHRKRISRKNSQTSDLNAKHPVKIM